MRFEVGSPLSDTPLPGLEVPSGWTTAVVSDSIEARVRSVEFSHSLKGSADLEQQRLTRMRIPFMAERNSAWVSQAIPSARPVSEFTVTL